MLISGLISQFFCSRSDLYQHRDNQVEDEAEGFEITYFPVLECVLIDPDLLKKAIRPDTGLVSIFMTCKTEIGVIQPIERMCQDQENVLTHHTYHLWSGI